MKQFSQQLHKKATTTVRLQAAEKRELRERLVAYMEYHPLATGRKVPLKTKGTKQVLVTDSFAMVRVPFRAMFKYGTAVAVILLVLTPFVAEKSVPGDVLYAIKVQFNEELRSTLTFGSFEKVEWETERLNRRIAEARLLASEGRLTEEVEAGVAAAVREHTENAKREIEVLRAEDADEATIASIALDTTLEVQATAFKNDAIFSEGEDFASSVQTTNLIADAIDESREPVLEDSASSTLPAYEKLMARVEQNTTRILELHNTLREVVPAEEFTDVTRRSEDLDRAITDAIALSSADQEAARRALVEVLQRSQRLIVFMTELEISKTVDIDTLVPVVPTDIEKQVVISNTIATVEEKVDQINTILAGVEDEAVREKAMAGQTMLIELSVKMASSTEDYNTFNLYAAEAKALANDTMLLLERYYTPVETETEGVEIEEGQASSTEVVADEEEVATSTEEHESEESLENGEMIR